MKVLINNREYRVNLNSKNGNGELNNEPFEFIYTREGPDVFHVKWKDKPYNVQILPQDPRNMKIRVNGYTYEVELVDKFDELLRELGMESLIVSKISEVKSPMPGLVLETLVSAGNEVKKGDPLLILEAMKMENIIKSPTDGVIKDINAIPGEAVEKNVVLLTFE